MAQGNVLVYDPKFCTVTVDSVFITGFAEDSKVEIEKNEDNVLPKVGVDGIVSYGINADGTAVATLKVMSTSPSLPLLRDLAKSRKPFSLNIVDMNDNASNSAFNDCIIQKTMDDVKGSKEPDEIEVPIYIPYFEDLRN